MRKPIDPKLFAIYYDPETGNIVAQQFCTNRRKMLDKVSPHRANELFDDPDMRKNNGWTEVDFKSGCICE